MDVPFTFFSRSMPKRWYILQSLLDIRVRASIVIEFGFRKDAQHIDSERMGY